MRGSVTRSSAPTQTKAALTSLILLGLIAVIPFLLPYHRLPLPYFHSESAAFALGLAACFPFLSRNFWQHLKIPHVAIWLFGVVVLIALQTLFVSHAYVTQALLPGIYISWAAVLVILSGWIREQLGLDRAVTLLAWMMIIGGTLQALIGLIQHFDVYGQLAPVVEIKDGTSVYGNINQRNHFATQITLASFALIYVHATGRTSRALTITLLALFALVLTASSSRAVAVYILAGFILSLACYRAAKTSIHRRLMQGSGLLLVLFLLFQYLFPLLNDWLKLLLGAMGHDVSGLDTLVMLRRGMAGGIDIRISEWRKAWLIFMESPFWGIGIGNYGWYGFNYQALPEFSVSKNLFIHHSHNLIMQVLAELGVAGLLLLVLMAAAWLRQALPLWKNPSHWLIFASVIVLLLHSNVEFPLWYSFFLGLAAILLGFGNEGATKTTFTPWLGQLAAWAILLLSGAILAITFLGFQDISRVYQAFSISAPRQTPTKLHAIAGNLLLTPWAEAAIVHQGVPDRNALDQQLAMTTRVMQCCPNSINVNIQIVYLALAGKSTEASALLKKAFIVYPGDFSKLACYWKVAPAGEVRRLWEEAEKLTEGAIECQTKTKTPASPS